eukprot:NODE_1322_length_1193_cov_105.157343_g1087_i0.p1 GENE.NODE_1322_length_1193_cov_105.157343_g1087_i0~~NODE_1322_length_1193_cov_105.157343_g1087_i0.p1  ORF type:complete len:230 (+),score=10.78 NODE_1322_length_1193_cov_105.157343_g1087_i0:204-893(+)
MSAFMPEDLMKRSIVIPDVGVLVQCESPEDADLLISQYGTCVTLMKYFENNNSWDFQLPVSIFNFHQREPVLAKEPSSEDKHSDDEGRLVRQLHRERAPQPQLMRQEYVESVVYHLRTVLEHGCPRETAGWLVLHGIWGISQALFDDMALSYLRRRDELMQQHVLFALAANDVPRIQNLSKYLHRLVKIYEENPQLCMFFFADGCNDQCAFVHPTGTPGWEALRARGVD